MALSLSKGRVRGPTDRPGGRRHNRQHTSGRVALSLSKGRGGLPQGLLRHGHIPPLASEGERIETDAA